MKGSNMDPGDKNWAYLAKVEDWLRMSQEPGFVHAVLSYCSCYTPNSRILPRNLNHRSFTSVQDARFSSEHSMVLLRVGRRGMWNVTYSLFASLVVPCFSNGGVEWWRGKEECATQLWQDMRTSNADEFRSHSFQYTSQATSIAQSWRQFLIFMSLLYMGMEQTGW